MTTERIAALLVAIVVALAPSLASAQREHFVASDVRVAPAPRAAVHLHDDDEVLTPPSAGEYVLPVLGIVVGGALVVGGVFSVLIGGLSAAGDAARDHGTSQMTDLFLGIGAGGLALGAVSIIASVLGLSSLRHRAQETEGPNLRGIAIAPADGGAVMSAWGTF